MFTERFVSLLQERKVSSYKLTKDTGLPNGTISKWRNGIQYPSIESLVRLADYFNVSTDYLLGRTDKPEVNR
ncbi:MAG: helix-turn-helix domain-containing protein [Firmicutes bacterium]|nr:helix-turn-helix domain-containing protein [Bacillota bacterium]